MLDYQENQLRQADEHTHDGDGHLEENTPQNKKGDCQIANLVHINGYASIMGGSIDGILYAAKHPHKHLDHQDEEHEISLRSIEQWRFITSVMSQIPTKVMQPRRVINKLAATNKKLLVSKESHSFRLPSDSFMEKRFWITLFKPTSDIAKMVVRAEITIQSLYNSFPKTKCKRNENNLVEQLHTNAKAIG